MRVTDISLYSGNTEVMSFSLAMAKRTDRFHARQVAGLDADDLIQKFYGFGNSGSKNFDVSLPPRELVLRLSLHPRFELGESYPDIRDGIYKAISSSRNPELEIFFNSSGATIAKLVGSIQKVEAAHFNELPEVQITINCLDPMFRAISPVTIPEDELADDGNIVVGDSMSNAPHGLSMELIIVNDIPSVTIQDQEVGPDWGFTVMPIGGFLADDVLQISSEVNNKYVRVIRDASPINMMDAIYPGSFWPMIFPGENLFYLPEFADLTLNEIEYYPAYWGV